jgi:hypothetical protein
MLVGHEINWTSLSPAATILGLAVRPGSWGVAATKTVITTRAAMN